MIHKIKMPKVHYSKGCVMIQANQGQNRANAGQNLEFASAV